MAYSNPLRTRIATLLLVLCCSPAIAGTLKGTVKSVSGQPVPFAVVYVQGTTFGTDANASGEYVLQLSDTAAKVIARSAGYKPLAFSVHPRDGQTIQHDFVLEEQAMDMKEVIILSGEDPAIRIMRQAIERREGYENRIQSFQSDIYLKGVLRSTKLPDKILGEKVNRQNLGADSSGKGVLYLCEEEATYYQRGKEDRTIIHSVTQSGNPNGLGFSQFPPVISFYRNDVQLAEDLNPRGFISPLNDRAFSFYNYKLLGSFQENGRGIFKIRVTPKRPAEATFAGDLYIVDELYCLQGLDLLLTSRSNMQLLDTMRITQTFVPLDRNFWIVKSQVLYPVFNILGFGMKGSFVTVYNNQRINQPMPDTLFRSRIVSRYDSSARNSDSSFWLTARPVSLEADELRDYQLKDSIRQRRSNPAYRDSIRRAGNRVTLGDIILSGPNFVSKNYRTRFGISSLLFSVNENTVEGLNIAPKITYRHKIDTASYITSTVSPRYGFSNHHFNFMSITSYAYQDPKWRSRGWRLSLEAGQYVFQFNPENPVVPLYNTFLSPLFHQNFLKLYERAEIAPHIARNYGNGLSWEAVFSYQDRKVLENTEPFDLPLPGVTREYSQNTPIPLSTPEHPSEQYYNWEAHRAAILKLSVSYQPGVTYTQYPGVKAPNESNAPVFTVRYWKGIPNIGGSKSDFDRWRINMIDDLPLRSAGTLSYNLIAGGFFNRNYVSIPDMTHLNGNVGIFIFPNLNNFENAPYYDYTNTEKTYGEAHIEYKLQGLITNRIPLLRRAKAYLVLGNNTFYARPGFYFTESFVGLDNLGYKAFRLFRIDFTRSWDSFNQQMFGIHVCIKVSALGIRIGEQSETEW